VVVVGLLTVAVMAVGRSLIGVEGGRGVGVCDEYHAVVGDVALRWYAVVEGTLGPVVVVGGPVVVVGPVVIVGGMVVDVVVVVVAGSVTLVDARPW
jgi:hypothetical protein